MSDDKQLALGTRAIHGGQSPDPSTGAVMTPIYATSTYAQASPGVHQGFEYSRTHNPTRFAYERCAASLEGGSRGFAFAAGLASTSTRLELLDSGDHVIAMDDIYGGSYRLFERVRRRSAGLDFSFVDLTDAAAIAVIDDPSQTIAMPASFRADAAKGWNRRDRSRHTSRHSTRHSHATSSSHSKAKSKASVSASKSKSKSKHTHATASKSKTHKKKAA